MIDSRPAPYQKGACPLPFRSHAGGSGYNVKSPWCRHPDAFPQIQTTYLQVRQFYSRLLRLRSEVTKIYYPLNLNILQPKIIKLPQVVVTRCGLDSVSAANRVIELSEQVPAPSRGAVGADAEAILRLAREKSDAELDALRLQMVGLGSTHVTVKKDVQPTIIANDAASKKNVETVMALYDEMINKNQPAAAVRKYLTPDYIQHNPLIPTSAISLGDFFGQVISAHKRLRVVVYKVVASGDHVFAHVNFVNLYSDDPNDRGVAGVDIYRFDANGKIAEHWDVLQEVPDPGKSANANGMF